MHKIVLSDDSYDWLASRIDIIKKKIKNQPSAYDLPFIEMIDDMEAAFLSSEHIKEVKPREPKKTTPRAAPVKMDGGCKDHPTYQAIKRPRTDCGSCWALYKKMQPMNYEKARRDFERKVSKAPA